MTTNAVYPLDRPLSPSLMRQRITEFNPILRAVREWQPPSETELVPHVLVKNNIGLRGFKTSAGSKFFENLYLDDAFIVRRLKSCHVDVFGTTNMTELAGFVTTEKPNLGYSFIGGFPQNPYGGSYPPGGSSTGSGVAVAAGFCDAALGTETRGSLMKPGFANGVFSFKPSRGSLSRTGIIPLALSFDSPGILARNINTIRTLYRYMATEDPSDPLSSKFYSVRAHSNLTLVNNSKTIGLFSNGSGDPSAKARLKLTRTILESRGFKVILIDAPKPTFDYKEISSLEFISGMDQFLSLHQAQLHMEKYSELITFYRNDPSTHPYGMDRLEDALTFPKRTAKSMEVLVHFNVHKAQQLIANLINDKKLVALASLDFVDWWSIGGGPSLVIPLQKDMPKPPLSIMLGSMVGDDETLLNLGERLTCDNSSL